MRLISFYVPSYDLFLQSLLHLHLQEAVVRMSAKLQTRISSQILGEVP
jgi:hypothetical protein